MKKTWVFLTLLLATEMLFGQQDPQYSMYQFNQMIINPAYAGSRDVIAAVALRRQQWTGFSGAPETNCFSIHGPAMNRSLGLGLTIVNDNMGPRNLVGAYGNVAYIMKVGEHAKLSLGVNAGYNRYQFDYSKVEVRSGQLPPELMQNQTTGALDINSGLYLRTSTFFVGLSATHLNSPSAYSYELTGTKSGFAYRLKTHLFFTLGKSFLISDHLIVAPSILVRQINGRTGFDLNTNFLLYKRFWIGVFYRGGYGPGGLMQFYFNNKFRAGLSYDTGLNDARRLGPSFEAMVGFDFGGKKAQMVDIRFL